MTETDHCAENALAERVNGILKSEYGLGFQFKTKESARWAVEQAVHLYNTRRPHTALGFRTPASGPIAWRPEGIEAERATEASWKTSRERETKVAGLGPVARIPPMPTPRQGESGWPISHPAARSFSRSSGKPLVRLSAGGAKGSGGPAGRAAGGKTGMKSRKRSGAKPVQVKGTATARERERKAQGTPLLARLNQRLNRWPESRKLI